MKNYRQLSANRQHIKTLVLGPQTDDMFNHWSEQGVIVLLLGLRHESRLAGRYNYSIMIPLQVFYLLEREND